MNHHQIDYSPNVLAEHIVPCTHRLFAYALSIWRADLDWDRLIEGALMLPIIAWRVTLYRNGANPSVSPILPLAGHDDAGDEDVCAKMLLLDAGDGALREFDGGEVFAGLDDAQSELRRRWKVHNTADEQPA